MRLRGELAGLREQLKRASAKPDLRAAAPAVTGVEANPPEVTPVETYVANVRAAVPAGQTLITGGWTTEPGKRTLLFVRPEIGGDAQSAQVTLKGRILEVPDRVLAGMRLDALKAEGKETSLQHLCSAEQAAEILKTLEGTEGVKVVSSPALVARDGQQAQFSVGWDKIVDGEVHSLSQSLDITPRVSADRTSVDLTMTGQVKRAAADSR